MALHSKKREDRKFAPQPKRLYPYRKNPSVCSGDAFCVALRRENSPAEIRGSVSRRRNANFELRRRVLCGPAHGKQSDRVFRAGETQILTSGDASSVQMKWIHEESEPDDQNRHGATARRKKIFPATVSRRRNANFDLRRCVFRGPAQ